jgi:hypothetical protein
MTRNLKALGLALVAVFAMSAVAAGGAQANTDHFRTHTGEPVELTVEALETQTFKVGPKQVPIECEKVHIDPTTTTVKDGDTAITARPTYNNEEKTCETPFGKGRVKTTGCHYLFTGETDGNGHAEVHINGCEENEAGEKNIMIEAPLGCIVYVPEQTVNGVHYTNEVNGEPTSDDDIVIEPTVTGIEYTAEPVCEFGGIPVAGNDGTYIGDVTVTGWEDDGLNNHTHGAQVGISVEETGV